MAEHVLMVARITRHSRQVTYRNKDQGKEWLFRLVEGAQRTNDSSGLRGERRRVAATDGEGRVRVRCDAHDARDIRSLYVGTRR